MSIYEISEIPSWVKIRDFDLVFDTSGRSPFSYPLVDYQEYITDNGIETYTNTYQVIDDASRLENASLIMIELHQGSQRLLVHGLDLYREGKKINALDEENISAIQRERSLENHIVDNRITVTISIDDLRVGDHLEFMSTVVEEQNDHPLMGKHFSSNYSLLWACPVKIQCLNVFNESAKELTLMHGNLKNNEEEYIYESIPPYSSYEIIHKNLSTTTIPATAPSWVWGSFLQLTTKSTWHEVSNYFYKYFLDNGALSFAVNVLEIEQLNILSDDSVESKALKIIRFVQNNIRYKGENHGIFTHTPKEPARTIKKRAGDCKDKSNLTVALLNSIGVEANLVLVNTVNGEKIKVLNPSAYHFNHMIVEVLFEGVKYYIDPTIQKQSGNFKYMTELDYGYGLPLIKGGSDLIEIKRNTTEKIFFLEHVFHFDKKPSDYSLDITRTYRRHRADNMRAYFSSTERSKLEESFLDWACKDTGLNLIVNESVNIVCDDPIVNDFIINESYRIDDIKNTHKDKRIELLTDFYHDLPLPNTDKFPVRIDLDGSVTHKIEIVYRRVPNLQLSKKEIKTDEFSYTDKVLKLVDKKIIHTTTLTPKQKFVAKENVAEHIKQVEAIRQRSNNLITHEVKWRAKFLNEKVIGLLIILLYVAFVIIKS